MKLNFLLEKSTLILNTKKSIPLFSPFQFSKSKNPTKPILLRYNVGRGEENVCE